MNKTKYQPQHFPVGTIAEFKVGRQEAVIGEVKEIHQNGANSYVVALKDTYCKVLGREESINIAWCTKIIKRGHGHINIVCSESIAMSLFSTSKHKSQYGTYDVRSLVYNISLKYFKNTNRYTLALVELCSFLVDLKIIPSNSWKTPTIINKKKLNKIIKQNINRFLIKKKIALRDEREEEELYDADYK